MRYLGGKSRIAKQIVARLPLGNGKVYEPFCGGASVTEHLAKKYGSVQASDSNPHLIALYQLMQEGWEPPTELNETRWRELKNLEPVTQEESALKAFAGFGCSFGGKWFGGYAVGGYNADGTPRSHPGESARNLLRGAKRWTADKVVFCTVSYQELNPAPCGSVIYCDPPYAGMTDYSAVATFNHNEFWMWADNQVERGMLVYVSESEAPDGWVCVWEKEQHRSVKREGGLFSVERLFTKTREGK